MKKLLGPLLAFLLSQVPSFAQSDLVLVIDKSSQTIDWVNGFSITRDPAAMFDNNQFGMIMVFPAASINSPLLNYSGAGSHTSVSFQFTEDRTRIDSIGLGTTTAPGPNATFSGTAEGPAIPTFVSGNFTPFTLLNPGEYTLKPVLGNWSGGIDVVVVPEPATWSLMVAGMGFVIAWRRRARG